jgi:hypothetical protein
MARNVDSIWFPAISSEKYRLRVRQKSVMCLHNYSLKVNVDGEFLVMIKIINSGESLVISRSNSNNSLNRVIRVNTLDLQTDNAFDWSPDGNRIVYRRYECTSFAPFGGCSTGYAYGQIIGLDDPAVSRIVDNSDGILPPDDSETRSLFNGSSLWRNDLDLS